jgi:hypothetical protein
LPWTDGSGQICLFCLAELLVVVAAATAEHIESLFALAVARRSGWMVTVGSGMPGGRRSAGAGNQPSWEMVS